MPILGKYGYTGHVINLPQDVLSFAQFLPRLPAKLDASLSPWRLRHPSICINNSPPPM